MSLDNIQFQPQMIQDMYGNSLVDLKSGNIEPDNNTAGNISFLGNNLKQVTIIVKSDTAIYLPEDELNFLLGILTACKLSMADVALVNSSKNHNLNYADITAQLNAEKVLLFGVTPSALQLPLQFPHYQVQKFNSQVYLSAPTLNELENDKDQKTKLWNCLKQVFVIA